MQFQCLSELVESFYEQHGCVKLVVDEYRKRACHPEALKTHRLVPKSKLYCIQLNVLKYSAHNVMMVCDDIAGKFTDKKGVKGTITHRTTFLWNDQLVVFHRDTINYTKIKVSEYCSFNTL